MVVGCSRGGESHKFNFGSTRAFWRAAILRGSKGEAVHIRSESPYFSRDYEENMYPYVPVHMYWYIFVTL
jgi:hypothetical protein